MGDEKTKAESFEHLQRACGYIRRRLGQMVKFRYLPELKFAIDEVLAHEMHINEIISELHREEGASEG
jgi:ribosome-binding factor A